MKTIGGYSLMKSLRFLSSTLVGGLVVFAPSVIAQDTEVAPAPTAPAPTVPAGKVLARINERIISVDEFDRRFKQNQQLVPGKAPTKSEVLKNIVYFELATQEARRLGIHKDQALKEQFDILLYQALVRRTVQPKVDALDVSEAEVRTYYQANPLLKTNHIILLSKPGMSDQEIKDLRARATKILEEVRGGKKSFEEFSKQYSEGPAARTGGEVDWGARHKLLPEYYEAALALKSVSDISGVVETPYGFHIIKLSGRKPYAEMDPVYKDFIIRTLRETKGQKLFEEYFEGLKKRAAVKVNEDLLK